MPARFDPRTERVAVSICGIGGQGIVLAGVVLGQAAVESGIWASQSAAYTVAARGGFARSEVILAPTEQPCPIAEEADVIVALAEEGWLGDRTRLKSGGLALCDEELTPLPGKDAHVVTVPFARIARAAGHPRSINVVALGVLTGLTGVVPEAGLLAALEANLGARPATTEALAAGIAAGRELAGSLSF